MTKRRTRKEPATMAVLGKQMRGGRIPPHVGPARKFKQDKRRDLRAAAKILSECHLGCAFTPAYQEIPNALELIKNAIEMCSVEKWGR